jgi:hypothetical protein
VWERGDKRREDAREPDLAGWRQGVHVHRGSKRERASSGAAKPPDWGKIPGVLLAAVVVMYER